MTSIDINSARATKGSDIEETAFNTNLEAAEEIARQLRLRDLGGLVVIDFIDMTPVRHQREVENRMRDSVRQDRARIQLGRISRFGLLEMSRQRLRPSIGETSQGVCPRCSGTGQVRGVESLALSILRLMEEEAIKENTQHVQAQVPVPVATYLLNEKRRSVMHIEKHHSVRVLILPNPHMDTPQYEVLRVKKDETVAEASYDISVKQAEVEEAKMPKFDKDAVKRDEPLIQAMGEGMSAPKVTSTKEETNSAEVKTVTSPTDSKPTGFFAWLKGLFSSEETVIEEKAPEPKPKQHEGRGQQRGRQGQRRNNRGNNRNNKRSEERVDNRNAKPEGKGKNARNNKVERDDENKQNNKAKRPDRKPEHDKNKPVKEEVVAERRQRRTNRKKVRVNKPKDTAVENSAVNVVDTPQNVTEKDAVVKVTAENAVKDAVNSTDTEKREERPRNRRSPRHLRSNGQRKRREKTTEQVVEHNVEIENDAIEARYPEHETSDNKHDTKQSIIVEAKTEVEIEERKVVEEIQQDLPLVDVEAQEKTVAKAKVEESTQQVTASAVKVEESTQQETASEVKIEESTQQETASEVKIEESTQQETATEVNVETKVEAAEEVVAVPQEPVKENVEVSPVVEEVSLAPQPTDQPEVIKEAPVVNEPKEAVTSQDSDSVSVEAETKVEIKESPAEKPVPEATKPVKKAKVPAKKKSLPKDKKLARQVKKANRLSGHATSPMTKTETITTINDIPTSFMASEDRFVHQISGRTAITSDVISRSSAEPTKPV